MLGQLFVAFVFSVGGMKERLGVAGVNGNGNVQSSGFLPDGVEAGVVHGDELARFVAHAEAEVF